MYFLLAAYNFIIIDLSLTMNLNLLFSVNNGQQLLCVNVFNYYIQFAIWLLTGRQLNTYIGQAEQ